MRARPPQQLELEQFQHFLSLTAALQTSPRRFECFLLKHLRHPNVVRFIGVCWDETLLACVLEYVSNGSLQDHLKKCSGKTHKQLTWKSDLLTTAQEISSSLEYLHHARYWHERAEKGKPPGWRECIIHRDLKPDNLLMTEDWTVKLADFGEGENGRKKKKNP